MVGDYKWDVLCANNAGTPCALLVNGGGEPEWVKDATFVITKLTDVIEIVEGKTTMTRAVVGLVTCSSRAEARKIAQVDFDEEFGGVR